MVTVATTYPAPSTEFAPLLVRAHLANAVHIPGAMPALDGLLAGAVAIEHALPDISLQVEPVDIEVPVARSACGRYHMATRGIAQSERAFTAYFHRAAPLREMQMLGNERLRRVDQSAGANKSCRMPQAMHFLRDDVMLWLAVGHVGAVRHLLETYIRAIGRKRGTGGGVVRRWDVEPVTPWGAPGLFPVVTPRGHVLRALPVDTAGVAPDHPQERAVLTYPYWQQHREEWCYVPTLRLEDPGLLGEGDL